MSLYTYTRPAQAQVLHTVQKKYPMAALIGLLTAGGTTLGYAVGGFGLLHEGLFLKPKPDEFINPPRIISSKSRIDRSRNFSYFHPTLKHPPLTLTAKTAPQFSALEASDMLNDSKRHSHYSAGPHTGVRTLRPQTALGKFGLDFGRAGVALAAFTGIFNGIAMRLPLMSIGDSVNLAAAPIIHTPLGVGLFHIGLASIFAGRALEQDDTKTLNLAILRNKSGIFSKAGYILQNAGLSFWEILRSTGTNFKNLGLLFTRQTKAAQDFFKNEFFNFKPRSILLTEMVNAKGKSFIVPAMKSTPYFMHTATLLLGLGGIVLTIGSLIKNDLVQKIGYRGCTTGGSLDNLSLFKQGFEKAAFGGPVAGTVQSLAGLTVLSGQNYMDTLWGRGLIWLGIALLFCTFAIERKNQLVQGLLQRKKPLWTEATQMIRRWELNPLALMKRNRGKQLTQLNKTILAYGHSPEVFAKEMKTLEALNPKLTQALDDIIRHFNDKPYQANTQETLAQINQRLQRNQLELKVDQPGKDLSAALKEVHGSNQHLFGHAVPV